MNGERMTEVLSARGIVKSYGRVQALRGASFTAHHGEVVALMGDNGAGKSTLVKCLSGVVAPDEGTIAFEGAPVAFARPEDAMALGSETVYQDLALAHELDAAANLYMGRELLRGGILGRLGVLDKAAMARGASEAFTSLSVGIQDAAVEVGSLSGGQRQSVAVARAVTWASKLVMMDEPTAALGMVQTERVRELIRAVRDAGRTVVLISHDLPFVLEVADRIEVLRLGQRVARFATADVTATDVLGAMTGAIVHEDAS
jgi:simple sugar transport system ATP-binding protein